MTVLNPRNPDEPLSDILVAADLSVTDSESQSGYTWQFISRHINENESISPALAVALERMQGSNAFYRVGQQTVHKLALKRRRQAA